MRNFIFALCMLASPALAVMPDEVLLDKNLEQQARIISQNLRCLVCQNQSIDDSDAPLAKDLRLIVRERLTAGDNDAQVKAYLTERFGNYVLLDPPMQYNTLLLWFAPFLMLGLALFMMLRYMRSRPDDLVEDDAQ
jgi:cytochrome c-type biogenesis protein CcmH